MTDDSAMGDYETELICHLAAKALVESDEIDIEEIPHEDIETAMWRAAAEASYGMYATRPKERDLFKHHPAVQGWDQ